MPSTHRQEILPSDLTPIIQLLHLTYHRNKNQHRLAKWWGSFAQLRRQLAKLAAELEALDSGAAIRQTRIDERVNFMNEFLVPRCYLAFSAVVADNQYASLGLMLMGTLARINRIIAPAEEDEDSLAGDDSLLPELVSGNQVSAKEDLGEAIRRETMQSSDAVAAGAIAISQGAQTFGKGKNEVASAKSRDQYEQTTPKPAKKRRKRRDSLDDIFSSLI